MTLDQITQYLSERQQALNISFVAKYIDLDISHLKRAINGQKDNKGTVMKIPRRCLPKLLEWLQMMRIDLPAQ